MREPEFISQFLRDVAAHKLYIEREDGLYRHLRFRATDADGRTSGCMGFDLVTWPGWLAYSGDMGSFMFTRTADMLAFFRKEERGGRTLFDGIDRRYWAEKCEAEGARGDGIKEFDAEAFKAEVRRRAAWLLRDSRNDLDREERKDLWEAIGCEVMDAVSDFTPASVAFHLLYEFSHSTGSYFDNTLKTFRLSTDDLPSCEVYTQRFNWCCCALAWGIAQYDAAKAQAAQPAANDSPATPAAAAAA